MNTESIDSLPAHVHAFRPGLSLERLRSQAPAAFADNPFARVSASYRFISTRELVGALLYAGFAATEARQSRARGDRAGYTRHLLRFRPLRTAVELEEAIPEVVIVNAHRLSVAATASQGSPALHPAHVCNPFTQVRH